MNIQDLKSNTTWQEASNTINNNNNKISLAIATLENAKLKNKGYFTTVEKLNEAVPNPTIGSKAYVGTSEPYAIYIVENGVWVDSGYTGGDEIVAKITTGRIEDGAVTTEKIATTAFDSTLSVSGKIAPADVVGGKITELEKTIPNKLDLRSSEGYQPFATTIVNDKIISAISHNPTNSAGNCYTTFNVSPGEKYHIKGYSFNSDYCGIYVHSTSPNTTTKIVIAAGDFDIDLTIPEGKTICSVNGKISGIGALSIEKWVETHQTSEEFYQEFDALSSEVKDAFRPHKYGIEILNNKVNVFIKGYNATHDAFYSFIPKSGNGLWDFYGVGKAVNADKDVRITSPVPADITWLSVGDTDYLSPSVVYAKTNADGDFPDTSTQKLTGGWHMYNNAASGNYTPTARNVSFKVFCDGVQVRNSGVRGNDVRIEIVNRLQGSNTEKADGTGREIVEQKFIITFDGFKAIVKGETIALEDVYYHTYYGMSAYYSVSQNSVFFLGSRTDRGGHSPISSLVRSTDKYGYGIRQLSGTDVFDTVINTSVDIGSFYANRASWSIQISSRKAYPFLIYAASTDFANMLTLNAGEQFTWEGYYDMHPSLL